VGNAALYQSAKDSLTSLESLVVKAGDRGSDSLGDAKHLEVRNPVRVRTKGRPRTGEKRLGGRLCHPKSKRRLCRSCGEPGHDTRTCERVEESVIVEKRKRLSCCNDLNEDETRNH